MVVTCEPDPPLTCEPVKPRKWWIATRTYTARCPPCPPGLSGPPVTVTRQYISYINQRDAEDRAMECAKKAAESAIDCQFIATACVIPVCGVYGPQPKICKTESSKISQQDANLKAIALAQAEADEVCAELL